jgi:hypothetical protein
MKELASWFPPTCSGFIQKEKFTEITHKKKVIFTTKYLKQRKQISLHNDGKGINPSHFKQLP